MAYSALNSTEVSAGKPTKSELFTKIKDNFSDHESRIGVLETAIGAYRPIEFVVVGEYWRAATPQTGALYDRVNFNITLTSARIFLSTAGTAGTLSCDVLYKRGAGSWTSIFSTQPSIVYTAGDNALSSNAVLSTTELLASDLLRFDISTTQTASGLFVLQLEFEKT